jgi:hypothetical protein
MEWNTEAIAEAFLICRFRELPEIWELVKACEEYARTHNFQTVSLTVVRHVDIDTQQEQNYKFLLQTHKQRDEIYGRKDKA